MLLGVALHVLVVLSASDGAGLTNGQKAVILETAPITFAEVVSTGVTETFRVELDAGDGRTRAASFQSVDEREAVKNVGGQREIGFVDSYRYNIAGYRLAELLGLGDMVPVSVERTFRGRRGAMTWWVEDVLMDEAGMNEGGITAPDSQSWSEQIHRVRVFSELIYDTDRNQGNLLITEDWSLWMIDFTRAFRRWEKLAKPQILLRCDRRLYDALRHLRQESLDEALGDILLPGELRGLWARRALVVEHFNRLISEWGEDQVLY